jgi:hypothetical protein
MKGKLLTENGNEWYGTSRIAFLDANDGDDKEQDQKVLHG